MLTYQLQPRGFRFLNETPVFPNEATILLTLEPEAAFGGVEGPSRIAPITSSRRFEFDANSGRALARSTPPLPPVEVTVEWADAIATVRGNIYTHRFQCEEFAVLRSTVAALFYDAPKALSQSMPDPVTCVAVEGSVGSALFRWEHTHAVEPNLIATSDLIDQRVQAALLLMGGLAHPDRVRLSAALQYLHVAKRLWDVADSPWEFAAEAVLNYAKVLEILFGSGRDAARDGLRQIPGLEPARIETVFIPVLLLRSHLDVAHPRLAQIDFARRRQLYHFVGSLRGEFTTLLDLVIAQLDSRTLTLGLTSSLELTESEQTSLDVFLSGLPSSAS